MACTVSISSRPNDIWIIRNTVFEWFVKLVVQRFPADRSLAEELARSEANYGLSFEFLREEDSAFARNVGQALLTVAREVAEGNHPLLDHYGRPWPELQTQTEHAFKDLVVLLTRFQQTNAEAPSDEKG